MPNPGAPDHGEEAPQLSLVAALRRLARLITEMAATRVNLAIADALESKRRLARGVILMFVGFLSALLMAAFAGVAILICFWDTHRVAAAVALPLTFAAVAIGACWVARNEMRNAPQAFAATLETLRTDRDALLGTDHGTTEIQS